MEEELKRCPFCGGSGVLESNQMTPYERNNIPHNEGKWYCVYCNNCLAQTSDRVSKSEAVAAWNRRE